MTHFAKILFFSGIIPLLCGSLASAANHVPVANDLSIATDKNMAVAVILSGSDADNNPLTYTVVNGPANGTLGGSAPNLTYTPNSGFFGSDSFTFKANDGTDDSNVATVSITVYGVRVLDYPAANPGTVKTFKVAVIMINTLTTTIADNPVTKQLEFYSPEKLGSLFFNHQDGTNSFIKEASYGKIALEGRVVGWLDHPQAGLNGSTISSQADYYLSLANNYLTYSDYDIFVVHALTESGGQQSGWLYPQQSFNTPQGKIQNVGITWMVNSSVFDFAPLLNSYWSSGDAVLPTTSWAHELLHTFGISGHANSYNCGNSVISLTGTSSPLNAYGGVFSIMGEHAFGTHPDALMKSKIGWISSAQIPEITTSGTYEIHPLVANDGQTKALVIPLVPPVTHTQNTAEFDALVLEYRTAAGFDRYLERLKGSTFLSQYTSLQNIDTNGVVVYMRYKSTATDATALLDMNPGTTFNANRGIKISGNVGKFADAILPVNRTFTWNNIQITPLGTTAGGAMRVNITFPTPDAYVTWSEGPFTQPFTDAGKNKDPDGDGMINFMEFAFGTDPTIPDTRRLAADGSVNGSPMPLTSDGGATFDLLFVRRKEHGINGGIHYIVQFSSDLTTFHDSIDPPSTVADSVDNPDYEIVSVRYPANLPNGGKASYGRIKITNQP